MDFKNVIIMSDLDGTLLDDKKEISQRDMESINEFCDKGGMFTIATGRGYSMARPVAEKLKLRIPAVIFNGSAVYDFDKDEFLWQSEVTQKARDYIKLVMDRFRRGTASVMELNTAQSECDTATEKYIGDLSSYWSYYYAIRQLTLFDFIEGKDIEVDFEELIK